ncbi:hypothetical protein SEUCBS140593_003367 [Sporothrix eucalyptigena]|uniref:HNH nuclease domain-containing protein n=1 Tax=Sporothrix eucalyptigena TaxID=1812306 RepID=A0ABP0BE52_9PEZI
MESVRDVLFSDLRDPGTILGGLIRHDGITNSVFHTIVAIAIGRDYIDRELDFMMQNGDGDTVPRNEDNLVPGHYLIVSDEPAVASTRKFFTRGLSASTGTRLQSFRDEVRARDQRCVITKLPCATGPQFDFWVGFEAAHIVPIAYAQVWHDRKFSSHVTIPPPPQHDSINSVQNGLLMQSSIHQLFDAYSFSILPEANYKIVAFKGDHHGVSGTYLDRQLLDDVRCPPDAFFRWHFEQAVLCNVRGVGEPLPEFDFPPGSDMMGELSKEPKAAERLEFEFFTRLGASIPLEDASDQAD